MIRRVEKSEIPACVGVIRESFSTVAEEFGFTVDNAPRFTAFSVSEEKLCRQYEDKNGRMYAYHREGRIVGYYSLELISDGVCELNNLSVLPGCRHEGIGLELLNSAFDHAKELGCTKMKIGIVEENKVLRRWYEMSGFVHSGIYKFDFFPFTCGYLEKEL